MPLLPLTVLCGDDKKTSIIKRTILAMEISSFHILKAFTCMHIAKINTSPRYAYSKRGANNIQNIPTVAFIYKFLLLLRYKSVYNENELE